MDLRKYRTVLALPGVARSVVLMLLARIPVTAASMVLTLHVVLTLHHGYGAAGLVGAIATIGIAIGAPLMGRVVDAIGLRRMLVLTTVGEGSFWLTAWLLPYPALLVTAFFGGLLSLPSMSVGRQVIAALVPEDQRRTAYSLDSISVEMTYMAGPALGVLIATRVSTVAALISVGAALVVAGLALFVVNPPIRSAEEQAGPAAERPPRRTWLTGPMIGVLATLAGAAVALAGGEVSAVAALRRIGEVGWTGPVTIGMCIASLIGGLAYGAVHRDYRPRVMMGLMSLLMVPVGLAGGSWWALTLALIPTNVLCAPTLAASNDLISRLAPAPSRGEANGLGSSAITLGVAITSPLVGTVIDRTSPAMGFVVAGVGGVLVAAVVLLSGDRCRPRPLRQTGPQSTSARSAKTSRSAS